MPMHLMPPGFPQDKIEEARKRFTERRLLPSNGRHYVDFEDFMPPGTPAPDFCFKLIDGDTITLADYAGKYVVLEVGSFT